MERDKAQYIKMTETKIPKLIISLAIPTIISMLITSIYNFADTYFVSKMGNTSATAAVGVVFSLMAIIQALGFMIGMGSGSITSRLLGLRKNDEANKIAISALISALLLGLTLTIFGLIFLDPLMHLLGASKTSISYAKDYSKYILLAAPIMCGCFTLNNLLRSEGKAIFSMVGLTIGGLLNIFLDYIYIFKYDMGISGAAVATMTSQMISFLILLSFYIFKKSIVQLQAKNISRNKDDYFLIVKTGLPSLFRQGLAAISLVILVSLSGIYGGDPGIAAMSIVVRITQIMFTSTLGIGQGYQPVVGYNYSAKKYKRVKKAFIFTFLIGTVMLTLVSCLVMVFAKDIVALFMEEGQDGREEVLRIGKQALTFQCLAMPFLTLNVVCNMTFQSIGKKLWATILSSLRQGLCFIPLIFVLSTLWKIKGVEISQPVADILTFMISAPFAIIFLKKLGDDEVVIDG